MGKYFSIANQTQQNPSESPMLKSKSDIFISINKRREDIQKLNWDINCQSLRNSYLKYKISKSYQNLQRSNIQYVICEFYIMQKIDRTQKRFIGLYETLLQNRQQIQIKIPQLIESGVKYYSILYFVFPNKLIYEVASKDMIKHKENIPQIQLKQKQDNYQMIEKLKKKVDQIKLSGFKPNILLVGKVGVGKSSFIRHTIKVFKQYLNKQVKMQQPYVAASSNTVTKRFTVYQFEQIGIRLIDSPGYGSQLQVLSTQQFVKFYKQIYKLCLLGKLDYDKFSLQELTQNNQALLNQITLHEYDYNKIIHLVLVFTDLNATTFQVSINNDLIQICCDCQIICHRLVNKIDSLTDYEYSGSTYALILNNLEKSGYNIQNEENFYPLTLKKSEIQMSEACKYLYFSMLFKCFQQAFNKVSQNTIHLQYEFNKQIIQLKIWQNIQGKKELKDIITKYFTSREFQKIQIKINNQWKSINSIDIYLKSLKIYSKFDSKQQKYIVEFRDKPEK